MTTRTLLLTLHTAAIASWLGADVAQHAMRHRWQQETTEATKAWARMQFWLHDRYYAVVAVLILASGIALVQDGHWGWSSKFTWVGIATIAAGASSMARAIRSGSTCSGTTSLATERACRR